MIKITPAELQSILNAAIMEMLKHEEWYKKSLPKAKELSKWLLSINWDEPYEETIIIEELPF